MPKPLDQAAPSKVNTLRRQPHHMLPLIITGELGRLLGMTKAAAISAIGDVDRSAEFLAGGVRAWLAGALRESRSARAFNGRELTCQT